MIRCFVVGTSLAGLYVIHIMLWKTRTSSYLAAVDGGISDRRLVEVGFHPPFVFLGRREALDLVLPRLDIHGPRQILDVPKELQARPVRLVAQQRFVNTEAHARIAKCPPSTRLMFPASKFPGDAVNAQHLPDIFRARLVHVDVSSPYLTKLERVESAPVFF